MIAILAAAIAAAAPSPAAPAAIPASPKLLGPNDVFRKAMSRMRSYPEPKYIDGTTEWHVSVAPRPGFDEEPYGYDVLERIAIRTADRMEHVRGSVVNEGPRRYYDLIEPAFFGPDAWAVHAIGHPKAAAVSMLPDVSGIKTIAAVVTYEKIYYRITIVGIEQVRQGHEAYHLHFVPLSEPQRRNLREMWIDTNSFDIWKAVTTGTYALREWGPGPALLTQDFGPVGGHWLVEHAAWSYDPSTGPYAYQFNMKYDNMAFPDSMPDAVFAQSR